MQRRDRGLGEVCSRVKERFESENLHDVFLFYSSKNDLFVAYIFYREDAQIPESEESGLTSRIKTSIREGLVDVGRGSRESLKIELHIDSHENVKANFGGDYYLRLR